MNYLQLAKRLREECGGAGTGPASITATVGEDRLYVNWINQAYLELQERRPNWDWMWEQISIPLVAGITTYNLESPTIQHDSVRIGGVSLTYCPWLTFSRAYAGAVQEARPTVYTIRPDNQLQLSARPAEDGLLTLEHYRRPAPMVANTDVPRVPERYHMILVYAGMIKYGFYENASEVLQAGDSMFKTMFAQLERDTLPQVLSAGPLA